MYPPSAEIIFSLEISRRRNLKRIHRSAVLPAVLLAALPVLAHVPYLEERDFAPEAPFVCPSADQSIAAYAWLESDSDVDFYSVRVDRPLQFYAGVLVPVAPQYAEFRPSFAVMGPGLPEPGEKLPVALKPGTGAIVLRDPGEASRRQFFEPFGNKSYYRGPETTVRLEPGTYTAIVWDPARKKGDYVAAIGKKEIWSIEDMVRAFRITPLIRAGKELHLEAARSAPPRRGRF